MGYTAFFDLDHTILKVNSGKELLIKAYSTGLLSFRRMIYAYFMALLYKMKLVDPCRILDRIASWLYQAGTNDLEVLCNELVEKELIPAIRPQIKREIQKHKEQGANVVMLSSALAFICFPLAKYLKMDAVICSELEEVDQQLTGRTLGKFCFRDEKLKRMDSFLQSSKSTRESSYYYGDSIDDLPVLRVVGYPVCVNPDKSLRKIAREHSWLIRNWD